MKGLINELIPSSARTKKLSLLEWIGKARITLRGQPYSFDRHEYLLQIVQDLSPDQTFLKGAQVGISTVVLLKALYVADELDKKAIYFFQDDAAVSDFSNDRCDPIVQSSTYLSSKIRSTYNVGLKQIGKHGALLFRGLFTRGKAKSVDGDFIVLDEVSEMKEEHRALARDRVMHSDLQWMHHLSQPDLPGQNIDAEFSTTDQHFWNIICPACGHRNCLELNFLETFIPVPKSQKKSHPEGTTHYRGCQKCQTKLDMKSGEWIAKYPSRKRRGYHLSQLYTQIRPPDFPNYASYVMADYEASRNAQARMARFTISILGFGYGGGSVRITDRLLDEMESGYGFSYGEVGAFMGVDQGDVLHISIGIKSGHQFIFTYYEETEDWGRLDALMAQFAVHLCIIDAMPNKHAAKSFAVRHKGRVMIQYFGGKELKRGIELHDGKWEVDTVTVDRTDSIDSMIDKMEQCLIKIPSRRETTDRDLTTIEEVRRHLKALTVSYDTNSQGITKRVYNSGANIVNHFGMASNSACVAAFELGVAPGPMVMPVFRKVA